MPSAADRPRDDLVGAGWLERIAHRYGIGVHLEPPQPRADLVQEVDPLPFVRHHRRGAVAGNTTQGDGVRWRRARRAGVQKGVARDELAQVTVVGDVEVPEPSVLRVGAVRTEPGQAVHRFGCDDRAHRFAGRVDQVQIVGLPPQVARRGLQHVVGEHGGELRAHGTEGPRHRRIHRAGAQVGAVELVHDPRAPGELGTQHVGVRVGRAEVVAHELVA